MLYYYHVYFQSSLMSEDMLGICWFIHVSSFFTYIVYVIMCVYYIIVYSYDVSVLI